MYFFTAVPYAFFLILLADLHISKKNFMNCILSSFKVWLLFTFFMFMMDVLFLSDGKALIQSYHYVKTRQIFLPLTGIIGFFLLIIQFTDTKYTRLKKMQLLTVLSIFLLANPQLISGFILSYKNYYDYGFSILTGISLVIFCEYVKYKNIYIMKTFLVIMLGLCLFLTAVSQGFDPAHMQYSIYVSGKIKKDDMKKILESPSYALISDPESNIAYSHSNTRIPPFHVPIIIRSLKNSVH